ncbi:MAG: hypothetical protein GXY08_12145 [Ruminococcus sp.]|nr:hypothetical protein [Ruminococcus sp.]
MKKLEWSTRTVHPSIISRPLDFFLRNIFILCKGVTKRAVITVSTAYHTVAGWFKIRTYHYTLSFAVNNI